MTIEERMRIEQEEAERAILLNSMGPGGDADLVRCRACGFYMRAGLLETSVVCPECGCISNKVGATWP